MTCATALLPVYYIFFVLTCFMAGDEIFFGLAIKFRCGQRCAQHSQDHSGDYFFFQSLSISYCVSLSVFSALSLPFFLTMSIIQCHLLDLSLKHTYIHTII